MERFERYKDEEGYWNFGRFSFFFERLEKGLLEILYKNRNGVYEDFAELRIGSEEVLIDLMNEFLKLK